MATNPSETPAPSRARNRPGHAEGQRRRDVIRQIMLERAALHPLLWPLTDAQMQIAAAARGVYLSVSAIAWHIREIRREAQSADE